MITITDLNSHNCQDAGHCDGMFTVDARLILSAADGVPRYTFVSTAPYQKRYAAEGMDCGAYLDSPDRAAFLADVDGEIAGELRLCRYWNRYAYIEDIVVDVRFRRWGVGRELLQRAKQWARDQQLAGLMLETQDNNVAACRVYEHCGFELGGFDRFLYRGLDPDTDEIALYWYWRPSSPAGPAG